MAHVDFDTRDAVLRLERGRLSVLDKAGGKVQVEFPCAVEDVRSILRGGSYQVNEKGAFLLIRLTPEGVWVLFERRAVGLTGSCLLAKPLFEDALNVLSEE